MNLPTKPIRQANVYVPGERAAGINSASFNLDVWIDLNCFASDKDKREHLDRVREQIMRLYSIMIEGDDETNWSNHYRVTFDFEFDSF